MNLTCLPVDPRQRFAYRKLTNPRAMHAIVEAAVAGNDRTEHGRTLWRLDSDNPNRPQLWIVSPGQPDMGQIMFQLCAPTRDGSVPYRSRDYRPLLDRLEKGQRYRFRVTGSTILGRIGPNTVVRGEQITGPGERRIRFATNREQRLEWLVRRSETAGFSVMTSVDHPDTPNVTVSGIAMQSRRDRDVYRLRFPREGQMIDMRVAVYVGLLEVTDPDLLRRTLTHGLGRSVAYGCGLMTLAPA